MKKSIQRENWAQAPTKGKIIFLGSKRESSMEMLFIKIAKPRFYELMCAGIRNNDNLNKTNFSKA